MSKSNPPQSSIAPPSLKSPPPSDLSEVEEDQHTPPAAATSLERPRGKSWSARLAAAMRWLHIYLSLLGFTALLFFAVTGLTLNHPTWLGADFQRTTEFKGELDPAWLSLPNTSDDPNLSVDRLAVVEYLRSQHHLRGSVSEFRVDDYECLVLFKGPAYLADVIINREQSSYTVTETVMGAMALLNDLHKGRDSGWIWSLVIDVSAIMMILVSITGFALIVWLKRRRWSGIITAVMGTIMVIALYLWGVP